MSTDLLDEYHALLVAAEESSGDSNINSNGNALDIATLSWSNINANSDIDNAQPPPITSSDTLVVVDMQHDFLPGGAFGVDEGDATIEGICELIQKFHNAGATVIATRDYHPNDHCSFNTHGGPFPPHCIMGTRGSFLHPRIAETLEPLLLLGEEDNENKRAHVVYKGFYKGVESFGGFQYKASNDEWKKRLSYLSDDAVAWTGAWALKAANIGKNANASPDVMSILNKKPCRDLLPAKGGRVFCCGLAYDYCVMDTAVNFVQTVVDVDGNTNDNKCFVVQNLTRAARIPGIGAFGSGFLTDPSVFLETLTANKIGLVRFVD